MRYEQLKQDLRRAYDGKADDREAMADAAWKVRERAWFRELLRAAGAVTLLEIGAGHGISGRYFADQGLQVTCVDLSPELVERCRAKGLTAQVMDFSALTFPAGSFDAVFGMNCLLHVPRAELDGVLRSIRNVLAPGGLFYWGQYGGGEFEGIREEDDYEPKRFFSRMADQQIQQLAAGVFELVEFRSVPLGPGRWNYQSLALRRQRS